MYKQFIINLIIPNRIQYLLKRRKKINFPGKNKEKRKYTIKRKSQ